MSAREADYLRFASDLRVPFDNNPAEQVIRMSKLRIKVSGCMRSMTGAETFCAIRSYLATAARHGISWLDALTRAAAAAPGSRRPDKPPRQNAPGTRSRNRNLSSYAAGSLGRGLREAEVGVQGTRSSRHD